MLPLDEQFVEYRKDAADRKIERDDARGDVRDHGDHYREDIFHLDVHTASKFIRE